MKSKDMLNSSYQGHHRMKTDTEEAPSIQIPKIPLFESDEETPSQKQEESSQLKQNISPVEKGYNSDTEVITFKTEESSSI